MPGEHRTTENVPFTCSAVGRVVRLTIHVVEEPGQPAPVRRIERTECDQCRTCTVGERTGESWTYRWHRCVHPVLKRQS